MNTSQKTNLIYAVLAGLGLLLIAPYFGLGFLLRGGDPEPAPSPRKRVVESGLDGISRRRLSEEAKKPQRESDNIDSALDDIEAMLGDRSGAGKRTSVDDPEAE